MQFFKGGHSNAPNKTGALLIRERMERLPGGPVAKTPCSQWQGAQVRSLVRELDPTCHSQNPAQPCVCVSVCVSVCLCVCVSVYISHSVMSLRHQAL